MHRSRPPAPGTLLDTQAVRRVSTVKEMTKIETWLSARLTPAERRALEALAAAWTLGLVAGWCGWPDALERLAAEWLDPPLPSVAELTARLPPGDPRPALYAASLALREERRIAASGPALLDPNTAGRAQWDRLPGIGPRTAEVILAHRARQGPFTRPEDLLAVPRIGPVTLAKIRPYLVWPQGVSPGGAEPGDGSPGAPDLNRVDEAFLASVSGIGPKLARTIVLERGRRRGFHAWSEVLAVKGIGKAKLAQLQNATRLTEARPPAVNPDSVHHSPQQGTR